MANNQTLFNKKLDNLVYIIEEVGATSGSLDSAESSASTKEPTPIILDATTDFSKKFSAKVSTNPVGDKTDRADHYRVMPETLSFSGVISNDVVNFYPWLTSGQSDTRAQEYVQRIEAVIKSKSLVTCYMPDGLRTEKCLITNFSAKRDSTWSNGFIVDITLQKIHMVTGAIESQPSAEQDDSLSGTSDNGSKTTSNYTPKEADPIATRSDYDTQTNVTNVKE